MSAQYWAAFLLAFGAFMLNSLLPMRFYGFVGINITKNTVALTNGNYAVLMITAVLLPAVYEELFFRGALQSFMTEKVRYFTLYGARFFLRSCTDSTLIS